jgi:uncharacterized 2Fe-2S/4Fe-4S cluster protein (DUF4445 family)
LIYGRDIISRITFTNEVESGLKMIHSCIINTINNLVEDVTKKVGIDNNQIDVLTIVGNACMIHWLLKTDPTQILLDPFLPFAKKTMMFTAKTLGIDIKGTGRVYLLPNIAGIIGSDTLAAIMALKIDKSDQVRMVIDIGTNVKIIIGTKKNMFVCAVAGSSALEGTSISCGIGAVKGAIDHVLLRNGEIQLSVIEDDKPIGICGSGLIEVISEMLELNIINYKGKVLSPHEISTIKDFSFKDRIIRFDGSNAFFLVDETVSGDGKPIIITQNDICQVQLAKAAICSAIHTMIREYNTDFPAIEEVLVTGKFGCVLDINHFCRIGLIPLELRHKVKVIEKAVLSGAIAAMLSLEQFQHTLSILQKVKYIEFSIHSSFGNSFNQFLSFPQKS